MDLDDEDFSFGGSLLDANTNHRITTRDGVDAKLFDGRTIHLKKKDPTEIQPEIELSGSFMDIDDLFAKAELRNRIKKNETDLSFFTPSATETTEMWTEKYRPRKFVDLCSAGNDRGYRQMFLWLKNYGETPQNSEAPPPRKIMLVHGPPGMGTTLAVHICARQLGYHVHELNAANLMDQLPQTTASLFDELRAKTLAALRLRIDNALLTTLLEAKGRPTCLVIDEIDLAGNTHDIIRVLGDVIRKDSMGKKKLNRPIICIANDIFVSNSTRVGGLSMDKLRPMCELVQLRRPVATGIKAIKDHLAWIARQEALAIDHRAINEVVDLCDADIRACINHLQFTSRAKPRGDPTRFQGQVDERSGSYIDGGVLWMQLTDLLFQRRPRQPKEEVFAELSRTFIGDNARGAPVIDRVMRGVFHRYLDYEDHMLSKPAELADWLGTYDMLAASDASAYSTIPALAVWSIYNEVGNSRTKEPVVANARGLEFESHERAKATQALADHVWLRAPVELKRAVGSAGLFTFVGSTLPALHPLLHPPFPSKVKSNLNQRQQQTLAQVAALVSKLELRLQTERDLATGVTSLQFSPLVDELVVFDTPFAEIAANTHLKQIQQVRAQLFPLLITEFEAKPVHKRPAPVAPVVVPAKRARTTVDFFKQRYDDLATATLGPVEPEVVVERIWVKYNEGFSNAVRKTIGWKEIWAP